MSELKAYKMVDEKYCTDCVCVIPSDVYLKSEADKMIAEKDKEIAESKNYADEVNKDFELVDNQNERLLKIVRHQKYKRCLAMAKWCLREYLNCDKYKITFWLKWRRRWLELAEVFK